MACVRQRLAQALIAAVAAVPIAAGQSPVPQISERARALHARAIVVDTHDDTTQRLVDEKGFDIAARNKTGSIDIPRMREGGLDALFFSIWVTGDVTGPAAVTRALNQIDVVREVVRTHPDDLVLATSAADIRRAAADRKIAALLGVEGGHMIAEDLAILRKFAALGVRYMTLTHSRNTAWADSSGDKPAHDGLTAFGESVVREMNRLGMMVDVSHVSDKTFFDALEVSQAPVIASHSSVRAISNSPRNMTDDMLRAVAKNGGVVMINYNAGFLSEAHRTAQLSPALRARRDEAAKRCGANQACSILERQRIDHEAMAAGELPNVTWEEIVAHIDHVAKAAGVDHVGLGSDFDGATMPIGMEDAAALPKITDALLKKGYAEADVEKILGGNFLRVMAAVERAAELPR
jgi:membrane dipeptidase